MLYDKIKIFKLGSTHMTRQKAIKVSLLVNDLHPLTDHYVDLQQVHTLLLTPTTMLYLEYEYFTHPEDYEHLMNILNFLYQVMNNA